MSGKMIEKLHYHSPEEIKKALGKDIIGSLFSHYVDKPIPPTNEEIIDKVNELVDEVNKLKGDNK